MRGRIGEFAVISGWTMKVDITVPIEDEVPRCGDVREGLPQLLDHPLRGRVLGCGEVQDAPSVMMDDAEAVQLPELDGRDGEEVHGRGAVHVIAQEGENARSTSCKNGSGRSCLNAVTCWLRARFSITRSALERQAARMARTMTSIKNTTTRIMVGIIGSALRDGKFRGANGGDEWLSGLIVTTCICEKISFGEAQVSEQISSRLKKRSL